MDKRNVVLKYIQENFSQYVSIVYEKLALALLLNYSDQFFEFSRIEKQWDSHDEIDIVALNPALDEILLFGWS